MDKTHTPEPPRPIGRRGTIAPRSYIGAALLVAALTLTATDVISHADQLPQSEDYQRVLRAYMATLTERDFDHGITNHLTVPPVKPDLEVQFRTHIFAGIQQPHVGGKRGIPAVNAPAHNFLLSTIEATNAIVVPPVWEEALATFIQWDSPGNVYHDNRCLKMRAFVTAAVKLMMVDNHLETEVPTNMLRADWNGYHLITAASAYPVFKRELPRKVRKAYETGLLRLGRKLLDMGPKGEEADYELNPAVGLWYAAEVAGDRAFTREAEAYARTLCTDPRFFHPAGYWVEAGGLDVGFGGMANFWSIWLALASDWPFAVEAVEKVYRLRAHLCLPEPDGRLTGPAEFNNRLGTPACEDQWHWEGTRDLGAAMLTDEALCLVTFPGPEQLTNAAALRTATFNGHLYGHLKNHPYIYPNGKRYLDGKPKSGRYLRNDEIRGYRWNFRMFPNGWNYPIEVIPAYEFYRPGSYAHIQKLRKQNSPMLQSPYLRPGTFVRNFGDAFIATKQAGYAAILHTGPVGHPAPDAGMAFYKGPLGFGGGQLCAFWTATAGPIILGRRGGLAIRGEDTVNFDKLDEWPLWPIHAVSGQTVDGKVFSSGRIVTPAVSNTVSEASATVWVSGIMAAISTNATEVALAGRLDYARTFTLGLDGVQVETIVSGDGKDQIAQLYETVPCYMGDGKAAADSALSIEFQAGGKWKPATAEPQDNVTAARVSRYKGALQIAFETPQRVSLSPGEWKGTYVSHAVCRNILIDLLGGDGGTTVLDTPRRVAYRIEPAAAAAASEAEE